MTDSTLKPSDSITVLGLPTRVEYALRRNHITLVGTLTECMADDITDIRNLGVRSLREVRRQLGVHGLALYGEEPPES